MRWSLFFTLAIWFYLLISLLRRRRRRVMQRLETYVYPEKVKIATRTAWWQRLLGKLSTGWIARWPQQRLEKMQLRLQRANLRLSVSEWLGTQIVFLCLGVIVGGGQILVMKLTLNTAVLGVALVLLSWIGPDFWLSRRITLRQKILQSQLPSTLDFLTVSVEAGLGFDQAMSKVAEELTGPMAQEMQRVIYEMQLGTSRVQALQRFSMRTGVEAIELFVSAVTQAEKLGIGLARVLRIQSREARRKQRASAQERAAKAPVKILFPLVIFVFPAMFVVILGPAAIHLIQMLSSGIGLG